MKEKKYLMIPFGIVTATIATLGIVCLTTTVTNAASDGENRKIEIKEVEINEKDRVSPTIKVKDNISLEEESKFKLSDYVTATDANGGKLDVTTITTVDTKKVGEQTITVTATDANGNFTQKNVKVTIIAKPTPTPEVVEETQTHQSTGSNKTYSYNNNSSSQAQTYTPTYQAPVEQPVQQEQQSSGTTYYAPEENTSSGNGFYSSESACRAAHGTGQCIPVVGDASGYTWQP